MAVDAFLRHGVGIRLRPLDVGLDPVFVLIDKVGAEEAHDARADVNHWIVGGDDAAADFDPAPHVKRRVPLPARVKGEGLDEVGTRQGQFEPDGTAQRKAAEME